MTKGKDLIGKTEGSLSNYFNFDRLHDMIDNFERRFFDSFEDFGRWHVKVFEEIQPKMKLPKVNVIDEPDAYKIEIAMAGFSKEDLELELKDNHLFIKLEKIDDEHDEDSQYLLREISSRSFRRIINLPLEIDAESASCTYKDGIATCVVGKMPEKDEDSPVKIKVE